MLIKGGHILQENKIDLLPAFFNSFLPKDSSYILLFLIFFLNSFLYIYVCIPRSSLRIYFDFNLLFILWFTFCVIFVMNTKNRLSLLEHCIYINKTRMEFKNKNNVNYPIVTNSMNSCSQRNNVHKNALIQSKNIVN